ncbi:putative lipoprotein YerB precursor [compost metagenome]
MKLEQPAGQSVLKMMIVLGCTVALAAGCGQEVSPTIVSPSPKPTAITVPTAAPTPTPKPFIFPLSGVPSDTNIQSRPFMVMVENSPAARPQSGLDEADIVYEILAEGEVTRFVAVYQSKETKVIGPVRSIRPYFVEIGDALDAVIVHAGWSQDAMDILAGRKLAHLDQVYGDDAFYWRAKDRKAPHNLYTSVEKMKEGAEVRKFRKDWKGFNLIFARDNKTTLIGQAVSQIKVPYIQGYEVSYTYQAATGQYARFMAGKPHEDKESSKQITATNVLVLEAKHKILDKEGRRDVDIFGPGKGKIFQQGVAQDITWEQKDGIIRAYAGSKEVPLLPGTTWVQVVPVGTALVME